MPEKTSKPFLHPYPFGEFGSPPLFLMRGDASSLDRDNALCARDFLSWNILRACIDVSGAKVEVLPGRPREVSSDGDVYVRDPYCVIPDLKIAIDSPPLTLSGTREREWEREKQLIRPVLEKNGYRIVEVPVHLEGGNLLYHPQSKTVFYGHRRNNPDYLPHAAGAIAARLKSVDPEVDVVPVTFGNEQPKPAPRLAAAPPAKKTFILDSPFAGFHFDDPRSEPRKPIHLDLCMSVLPGGEILLDSSMIPADDIRAVQQRVGKENVMSSKHLLNNHNMVAVGHTLIMPELPQKARALGRRLLEKGYNILTAAELARDEALFDRVWQKLEQYGIWNTQFGHDYVKNPIAHWLDAKSSREYPRDADKLKALVRHELANGDLSLFATAESGPHCATLDLGERYSPRSWVIKTDKGTQFFPRETDGQPSR